MDLVFLGIDPNFGQVIQGTLIVLVVMIGGLWSRISARTQMKRVRLSSCARAR